MTLHCIACIALRYTLHDPALHYTTYITNHTYKRAQARTCVHKTYIFTKRDTVRVRFLRVLRAPRHAKTGVPASAHLPCLTRSNRL